MPSTSAPTLGLRDRKREQTRARIEKAAVRLVLRDGLEAATVDAISEQADVSPRTFFNYFESKDAAILGVHEHDLDTEEMTAVLERSGDESVLVLVVRILVSAMDTSDGVVSAIRRDRLEIVKRHPEVLSAQFAQLTARADRLTAVIGSLLAQRPEYADVSDPADLAAQSGLLLALGSTGLRIALREWADDTTDLSVDTIEQRAVALLTTTLERLS